MPVPAPELWASAGARACNSAVCDCSVQCTVYRPVVYSSLARRAGDICASASASGRYVVAHGQC